MFSIYTSAFFLNKNKFNYDISLTNFCNFVGDQGEVVISVPQLSGDDTFETLLKWREDNSKIAKNLHIFICHIDRTDPGFDGKVKDFALQKCNYEVLIQMDMDEVIPLIHKDRWINYGEFLLSSELQCFMIPTIDLWKGESFIRWDEEKRIGYKWRMHKRGFKRGVYGYAKRQDGTHDITKSDSCELLNQDGSLVSETFQTTYFTDVKEIFLAEIKEHIYTVHLGYLNIQDRIHRNISFWEDQWSIEDGNRIELPKTEKEFDYPVYPHGLFEKLEEII